MTNNETEERRLNYKYLDWMYGSFIILFPWTRIEQKTVSIFDISLGESLDILILL